jgi:hypothetical protein
MSLLLGVPHDFARGARIEHPVRDKTTTRRDVSR